MKLPQLTSSLALALWLIPFGAGSVSACEIRAVVGLHKPPYIFEPTASGLEHELFANAMAASRCTVRWTHAPPARALAMLRQQETDVMLTARDNGTTAAHFSEPYIVYNNVAISLDARYLKISRIEDLSAYRVLAFQNARLVLGERFRTTTAEAMSYQEIAQQITQVRMLFSGRADVVVGDRRILEYLRGEVIGEANSLIQADAKIAVHELFEPTEYRAAFNDPAMRDRFNQGLAQIRANGTYARVIARYRNAAQPRTALNPGPEKNLIRLAARKSAPALP
jgi:polar amino acid transport system substrate-binding protein